MAVEPVNNNTTTTILQRHTQGGAVTVQERPTMKSAQSQSRMPESWLGSNLSAPVAIREPARLDQSMLSLPQNHTVNWDMETGALRVTGSS